MQDLSDPLNDRPFKDLRPPPHRPLKKDLMFLNKEKSKSD